MLGPHAGDGRAARQESVSLTAQSLPGWAAKGQGNIVLWPLSRWHFAGVAAPKPVS